MEGLTAETFQRVTAFACDRHLIQLGQTSHPEATCNQAIHVVRIRDTADWLTYSALKESSQHLRVATKDSFRQPLPRQ